MGAPGPCGRYGGAVHPGEGVLLVAAAALGGALNAVAGGGSFFTFPALILAGTPSIPANATSTLALWPGSVASAVAYRNELSADRGRLWWFFGVSLLGGTAGALLLIFTPPSAFDQLIPLLLLVATVLFATGPRLTAALREKRGKDTALSFGAVLLIQFLIAIYGGYFGGGMGMMMLAAYSLLGMTDVHRMNGLKAVLAVAINLAALVTFVASGVIVWTQGVLMTAGAILGGYGGAALARRIAQKHVRAFIVVAGFALTAAFFVRAFR